MLFLGMDVLYRYGRQNGRDSHVRQIKVHSPIETTSIFLQPKFTDIEIAQWSSIR